MDGHYIGLMSGTSMDAVDAALVELRGDHIALVACRSLPLPDALRAALIEASHDHHTPIAHIAELDVRLGRLFAEAALDLLRANAVAAAEVRAIGSHGQTVYHRPQGDAPTSLQIADPNLIAELTGITTVADFRRRDIAAGGEGAPLVPAFHDAVFRSAAEDRVVLNLGGIANVTLLPRDRAVPVRGFDTGPANALMDHWVHRHRRAAYDDGGAWAASGRVQPSLLTALLREPYFTQPPPKSTGRELFNPGWLNALLMQAGAGLAPADVQATLCELTAVSVADAIQQQAPSCARVLVCGGGAYNATLMARLAALLARPLESTARHGIDPKWVEAMAFAWLARQTLLGRPGNLPAVTGARAPVVLGAIYPGGPAAGAG